MSSRTNLFRTCPPRGPFAERERWASETHRPALPVEEACIGGDDSRVGRDNLLYGAPQRGASGRDETEFRHVEISLERAA